MSADRPNSMVSSRPNVNRHDSRITRPLDPDVVPRAGPDRARRSIHALRAQTPRGGDHWPFLVVPSCPSLQAAGAPSRARSVDGRAGGGWAAAAAFHDHRPRPRRDQGMARDALTGTDRAARCRPAPAVLRGSGSADDRRALAVTQLALHRAALARYGDDRRGERGLNGSDSAARTVEHWRGVTLPMGLLYERAAVEFWEGVAAGARVDDAAADRLRAEDDGARLASNEARQDVGGEE